MVSIMKYYSLVIAVYTPFENQVLATVKIHGFLATDVPSLVSLRLVQL